MKEVLCYESSHGGAPYEYGQPGFIAWDFGEVYLDLTSNREEPAEEQNALIQTMSEAWFGCPGEQKAKYGFTSAYFVGEPRVKAWDYQFSDDRAEVTVSRSWKGQKLYDARYTFVAEPAPEGLEGKSGGSTVWSGLGMSMRESLSRSPPRRSCLPWRKRSTAAIRRQRTGITA